jgi:single-stranded-DNA-specific exonuclease
MDAAADRLAHAVRTGEKVGIFGDYDVDGACAAALLATGLRALGCVVATHIPDRIREGYGPNLPALERLVAGGAGLVVCVDCGTAAGDVLDGLAGRASVVVLDHHKADLVPRGIVATVNPNRLDDDSGLRQLCAAGVVFLALVATLRRLRAQGWFAGRAEPDLMGLLDIVALATICDVVPLTGLNRALVSQGLRVMARRARPGLAALLDVAGTRVPPTAFTCGYALGPRINAGGRIGEASLGLRLLLAEDEAEATSLAAQLDAVNRERQTVEGAVLERAVEAASDQLARGHAVVVLEGLDWHPGIVGIVAGRLKARFNRPVCVGAQGAELTKGSGRSVAGLDLGAAVIAARQAGLLVTGGGHAMAAGYGHGAGRSAWLHEFLDERLEAARERPEREDLVVDGALTVAAATLDLAHQVARLAPFGPGNEEPCFVLTHARVVRADRLGAERRTLRVFLEGEAGSGRLKGILFRADDHPAAQALERTGAPPHHLAGHLRVERWNDSETVCFAIEDAAMP